MNDLISIVINVYNGEQYIKKCLESVVNQTYKKIEILIINDGSTDRTVEICKSFKDNRIRIINKQHMGISLARNIGIEKANGKYIYFIDSDDFIEKDVIQYLHNLSKKHKAKISTCKSVEIYNNKYRVKKQKEIVKLISSKDMLKKVFLTIDNAGTIWNKLIEKDLFNNIRFEDRIMDDATVVYKLVINSNKIAYSNQIKYFYYRHDDSLSKKQDDDRLIDLYKVAEERYKYVKNIYPDFVENKLGLMNVIMLVYSKANQKAKDYIKKEEALIKYKELFNCKMLICNISIKEKLKILLFKVNPNIYRKMWKLRHY